MAKEDDEDFENSTKCWICDNIYVYTDVKIKYHCHITETYRGSVHIVCNINVDLKHKSPIAFHNLKKYDSHPVMQELDKFHFKINFKLL